MPTKVENWTHLPFTIDMARKITQQDFHSLTIPSAADTRDEQNHPALHRSSSTCSCQQEGEAGDPENLALVEQLSKYFKRRPLHQVSCDGNLGSSATPMEIEHVVPLSTASSSINLRLPPPRRFYRRTWFRFTKRIVEARSRGP